MSSLIVHASPVSSREKWEQTARLSPHATFFHTPHWQDLALKSGRGFRDASLEFELSDGSMAYLPLTLTGTRCAGLLARCISTFAGCYGGPVTTSNAPGLELAIQRYLVRHRYARVSLVGNPLAPTSLPVSAFRRRPLTTHMLRLDRDFETLVKGFTKGHRAAYKKGLRLGMQVRRANDADERQYVALYEAALARWGARASSRYSADFFRGIFDLARRSPELVTTWVAVAEAQEVVAGGVFFYWNKHVVYWHGVSNPSRYADSATTALLGEVIKDAKARDLEWFDFNPSGGHDGVAAFKKHFGATEIDVGYAEYSLRFLRVLNWWRARK